MYNYANDVGYIGTVEYAKITVETCIGEGCFDEDTNEDTNEDRGTTEDSNFSSIIVASLTGWMSSMF